MERQHPFAVPDPTVPSQRAMVTSRTVVRPKYAIIPASISINYNTYPLPFWQNTRVWVFCSPEMGDGVSFCEYMLFIDPSGGSQRPETDRGVESFLFVLEGEIDLSINRDRFSLSKGGFAFIPCNQEWRVHNQRDRTAKLLWVRKLFEPLDDLQPEIIVGNETEAPGIDLEGSDGLINTQYLIPADNIAYDMQMNINNWEPGSMICVAETHVMEHGLYMLQGAGVYLLNEDWYEVQPGDFIWMGPFCPQSYYCGGPDRARYLLYKNMNRQISFLNKQAGLRS